MTRTPKSDILAEIVNDVAKAQAEAPAFVEIGGVKYFRDQVQAADPNRRVKKPYRNPKRPQDEPVEMELEQVLINVAPYADGITLDSVKYFAGRIYEVPVEVARTMRDICQQTWRHESSTGGAYTNGNHSVRGSASQVGVIAPGIAFA